MKLTYENGEQYFMKFNQVFHLSLAVSLLPFGLLFLAKKKGFEVPVTDESVGWAMNVLLTVLILSMVFIAQRAYKKSMSEFDKGWPLRQKLDFYYEVSLRKYLWLGGASLAAVAGYAIYDGFLFIGMYVALLFFLSLGRPTERNLERSMQLTNEEKTTFRDREETL